MPAHAAHAWPRRHRRLTSTAVSVAAVALVALAGLADTHTVRSGETLGRIARRYGTTVDAIAQANGIADVNLIRPGTVLVIPGSPEPAPAPTPAPAPAAPVAPAAPAPAATGPVHTVRPGETLFKIAQRYDTTVDAIVTANAIADRRQISVGQPVVIPVAAPAPAPAAPAPTPAPAPTNPAPAAPAPAASGTVHTVRSGETLGRIARRHGTTVDAILALNPGANRNVIHAGDQFAIPVVAAPPPSGVHVVQPGDTMAAVAAHYGVTVEAVAAANGLAPGDMLIAGNRLFLTAQNSVPAAALAACPVPGATVANGFGYPRSDARFHDGIDLFAPLGTPVLAPVSGRLQQLTGPIGGNQFILRGDDGHRYAGSHLSAFGAGGRVAAGSVIGYVGDTGNAAGAAPHLHFEVRPGGGASVNPFSVVDAAC
jgi:LysM repeat protein